ncbi:DUF456 domain-containing protein [Halapricum desulfuricans]|uniref:Uncharacterized membrane protein, DUF456 family n=1 Tax=Halapricum desulfuricans TaxID=2841257 RepID=A0A897N049_9EURY|nr:DUF456 domain-containing protein [Halapricum desulfuricans]QSG06292.1 Uncharacterized membrane protein, DUF456 family [Halapricum desulfuricans]
MIRDPTILASLIRGVPIPGPFVVVAFALLIAGVVFSVVPLLPGPVLSVGGVLVYRWATGDPGPLALTVLLAVGVAAVLVDWLGGAAAAKGSGVSTRVSLLAGVAGLAGTVVAGPVGLLVGVAGTVFLASYAREREAAAGIRTAAYATAGVLGTVVVQTLLTGSILLAVVVIALL